MKIDASSISVIALATMIACSKSDGGSTPQPEAVVIGSSNSLSGDLAGQGRDFADTMTLAIEEINAQGGILGRPARVDIEDDGTTEDGAKVAFSNLVGKHVPVIVGPSTSGQASALGDLMKSSGVLTIGATTTSPELTTLDDGDFFFRTAPSDTFQGQEVFSELIQKTDPPAIQKLCILYRNDSYGTDFAKIVGDRANAAGIQTVQSSYSPDETDLSGVIKPCNDTLRCGQGDADAGADAGPSPCSVGDEKSIGILFLTFVADGASIMDSASKLGWNAQTQRFLFTDGVRDQGLLSLLANPGMLEGGLGTSPSGPDPSSPAGEQLRQLLTKFTARFNRKANLYIENVYDAVFVGAAAIEAAGTDKDPKAVRDAVRTLQDPAGEHVATGDWQHIVALIDAKKPINLDGASGSLDFDANGDILPPYYYSIWTVKDGLITDLRVITLAAQ